VEPMRTYENREKREMKKKITYELEKRERERRMRG